jgi:putative tryptophan/tyrosine transport system substrate-binding protein
MAVGARRYAAELVALGPDVILASGDHSVVASRQASRTVPIVFTPVADPVGTGYVDQIRVRIGLVPGMATEGPRLA